MNNKGTKVKATILMIVVIVSSIYVLSNNYEEGWVIGIIGKALSFLILLILSLYLVLLIQVIVHEMGHLIFGILTGYKLVSLHIGKYALVSDSGKYKIRKDTLNENIGLCKMKASSLSEDKFPFILFYLGGPLANLIFGVLFLLLYIFKPDIMYLSFLFVMFSITGMALALINGIPMYAVRGANDGMRVFLLISSLETRRAFWANLYIGKLIENKYKMKDVPRELFNFSIDMDLRNPFICTLGVLRFTFLCAKKEDEEAIELGRLLLNNATGISEEQRNVLLCGLMSNEMTGLCRKEEVDTYYTAKFQRYAMESSIPAFKLQLYAYELLMNRNTEQADKYYKEYEKLIMNDDDDIDVENLQEFLLEVRKKEIELEKQDVNRVEA